MIRVAAAAPWIQRMNFRTGPDGAPRVTIQKLRVPSYWPALALRRLQATP
jgi:hypothetical protein